jgi:mRNA interferase RelE/StbE
MTVILRKTAVKYLDHLPEPIKGQITAALTDLSEEPPEGDIKPMTGQPGYFRLRVGSYRVLFKIENNNIFVIHISPRGQAYTKKTRGKK